MAECLVCGKKAQSTHCFQHKPRQRLQASKPMNRVGKVQKRTAQAVAQWKQTQKPNHQGYYQCYICGRYVDYLMAEHVKSKARHPELRTDHNNLKPTCSDCNARKGSHNN